MPARPAPVPPQHVLGGAQLRAAPNTPLNVLMDEALLKVAWGEGGQGAIGAPSMPTLLEH